MEEKVENNRKSLAAIGSFFAGLPKQSPHPFSDEGFLFIREVSSTKYLCHFLCAISHKWQR
ncbi:MULTISPECIES: hypothetical protein [Peribacillus]|uniref:Uncharacterized protein n=1 Tax=Peribacillus castrilensis TaxID=2897690 RepID=A0AAW9N4B2_9BACI|nr:hypothetical protein [Peribacillus frigoritolerans]MEC0271721.1 hypothetical protein [Peribacillus castrilensis]MEC0297011.1 hypothetical protein [Peribacillus castrilensis]TFH61788.1 hypothetical protein E4J71_10140 [Peribacillus frigoritolerans]